MRGKGGFMVLILYLSIVLIIVGAIFLITSVEVVRLSNAPVKAKSGVAMNDNAVAETQGHNGDSRNEYLDRSYTIQSGVSIGDISGLNSFDVTLYNDENGISFRDSNEILSDISMIKGVVRVGRGIAEVGEGGLTVRIEKTLYRFDYYRLDRLETNGNFAILSLQGVNGKSILLSEHEEFSKKIKGSFSSFKGIQG
jgi:hypothetical protein